MELKEFVSQALIELMEGIIIAQKHAVNCDAIISPNTETRLKTKLGVIDGFEWESNNIEFDVAISTSDNLEGKVGAGIFVAPFSLGGQTKGELYNQTVSRLKFSIPIFLPGQKEKY